MRNSHSSIAVKQEFGNRLAHDIASTDNYGFLARHLYARLVEEFDDTFWGTWEDAVLVEPKACHVLRVETVHIFLGRDSSDDFVLRDMFWQWQLHEDTVHEWIVVEFVDLSEECCFTHIFREFHEVAVETTVLGCFDLAAHIRAAGWVVTYNDDHEAWAATILLRQCIYFDFHRILEGLRDLFTVYDHIFVQKFRSSVVYSAQWAMSLR